MGPTARISTIGPSLPPFCVEGIFWLLPALASEQHGCADCSIRHVLGTPLGLHPWSLSVGGWKVLQAWGRCLVFRESWLCSLPQE